MKYTGFLSIILCSAKANSLQSLSQEKKDFTLSSNLASAAADLNIVLSSLCQSLTKDRFLPSPHV